MTDDEDDHGFTAGDRVMSDLYPEREGVVMSRLASDGRLLVSGITPAGLSAFLAVTHLRRVE
jgi:hypothetical protein